MNFKRSQTDTCYKKISSKGENVPSEYLISYQKNQLP